MLPDELMFGTQPCRASPTDAGGCGAPPESSRIDSKAGLARTGKPLRRIGRSVLMAPLGSTTSTLPIHGSNTAAPTPLA